MNFLSLSEGKRMFKILVLEDDVNLNESICLFLNKNGYFSIPAYNASEAYDAMFSNTFDLIISDIMMPGADGFEFATTVRETNSEIPILFMTALDDFSSKQKGYSAGIDDYMVKPINLDELLLHVNALMRRAKIATNHEISVGSLVLNIDQYSATIDGKNIPFSVKEFNILYKLLSYPKQTFSRTQLLEEFWPADKDTCPRTIDVYLTKIREKISECKDVEILTVYGLGYKAVIKNV